MEIDIGFWLTLAVFVSGVIWLADKQFRLRERGGRLVREVVEFTNSLLPVFFVVLVIRSFIVEPFTIPSGSMLPTLEVNDFILVNKFAYGLRLPVTNTRIVALGDPQRGDVMVFRYPLKPAQNFIKRVVGVPGDHVVQRQGQLYINGEPLPREALSSERMGRLQETLYVETLDDSRHLIRHETELNPFTGQPMVRSEDREWTVGEGEYFMVGDNRNNSNDSRYWGMVPEDHIVGKAFLIWMHWRPGFSLPSFSRNGAIDKVDDLPDAATE
ncbi:signal peptidase I [Alcanivorax quisquiliarum]|uniref:Signal peptidase I n=1 Tax=Alcanivorax quisquiliarum TaxID=2933565 RepID=A0ABT0E7V7_9GAMM|nr:signal peptidase I [Alcanivorax quisquiliarum]MCK0537702.1 signal peptidase I [Alcanivorax quisquiliarum]